jgi:hypothetical protein
MTRGIVECKLRLVIDGPEWDTLRNADFWSQEKALGGQYTYRFALTTIGIGVHVYDNVQKKEINITDYGSW